MEEFQIQSKFYVDRDEVIAKLAYILRACNRSKNTLQVKKLVSQFRADYIDFEYDAELNAAFLFYTFGNRTKCVQILESIRDKLFEKHKGEKLMKIRIKNFESIGNLDVIPTDVMQLLFD